MRICFSLAWAAGTAVLGLQAGGIESPPARVTSVVRPDARTGRLVRSMVVSPRPISRTVIAPRVVAPVVLAVEAAPASGSLDQVVNQIARQNELPPQLIHSVIKVESNYNPYAISPKGALGLMQLVPATARRFGVSNVFNPIENIQGGARYLKYLLGLFNGNYPLALAAYNAGEAAVARYGGVPPFPETRSYLIQVRKRLEQAQAAAERQAQPARATRTIREVVGEDGKIYYVTR